MDPKTCICAPIQGCTAVGTTDILDWITLCCGRAVLCLVGTVNNRHNLPTRCQWCNLQGHDNQKWLQLLPSVLGKLMALNWERMLYYSDLFITVFLPSCIHPKNICEVPLVYQEIIGTKTDQKHEQKRRKIIPALIEFIECKWGGEGGTGGTENK